MNGSRIARWQIVASVAALGLLSLASITATARPGAAQVASAPKLPLRAIFYLSARLPPALPAGRAGPTSPPASEAATIRQHLAALVWARADAAIVPWGPAGSSADRRLGAILAATRTQSQPLGIAALIDRPRGSEGSQLQALANGRARAKVYLRIGSRPAVFVAPFDRSQRGCAHARRWRSASAAFWLAQATFPGYGRCRDAADAWFRDDAAARVTRASRTILVRPGVWPSEATAPTVARSSDGWTSAIARADASGAALELIDSLNDWQRGTAIEPSSAWPSASGFGTYLDVLHASRSVIVPGVTEKPSLEEASVGEIGAHQATASAAVSAGSAAAAWHVEFGTSTTYGLVTPPVSIAAGTLRQRVTLVLPGLSANTGYHARLVIASSAGSATSPDLSFSTLADGRAYRVAAAGDIACDPAGATFNGGAGTATECHQRGVSDAILAGGYDAVLPLGDLQYENGRTSAFQGSYDPSWGRLKAITHPAIGNHEYGSPGGSPYFQYFGTAAGNADQGYYSYELGSWHVVVLNSNCDRVGCGTGSAQELWLRGDLAAHPARCTLAYWHHPRFSSGQAGDDEAMAPAWSDLQNAGAELVLAGHDHEYERFAPQTSDGDRDDVRGIREFVVGTGGKNHMTFKAIKANSEVHETGSFGFLELTLGETGYAWRFVSDPPGGLADSGSGTCH